MQHVVLCIAESVAGTYVNLGFTACELGTSFCNSNGRHLSDDH